MVRRKAQIEAFRDAATGLSLQFRPKPVLRAAGRAIAKQVKYNLRRGKEPDGKPLPKPIRGGRPLRKTGQLIKSIKGGVYRRRGRFVVAIWSQGTRSGRGIRRNAGLLGVLVHGRTNRHKRPRMDPMRYVSEMSRPVSDEVAKELNKQIGRGKAGLRTGFGRSVAGSVDAGLASRLMRQ